MARFTRPIGRTWDVDNSTPASFGYRSSGWLTDTAARSPGRAQVARSGVFFPFTLPDYQTMYDPAVGMVTAARRPGPGRR